MGQLCRELSVQVRMEANQSVRERGMQPPTVPRPVPCYWPLLNSRRLDHPSQAHPGGCPQLALAEIHESPQAFPVLHVRQHTLEISRTWLSHPPGRSSSVPIRSATGHSPPSSPSVRRTLLWSPTTCTKASTTLASGSLCPAYCLGPAPTRAHLGETAFKNSSRLDVSDPW